MTSRHTSRRTSRALRANYARGVYLGYASAYRTAAREQGVAPADRWKWLCTYEIRHALERQGYGPTTGAGLLAFNGNRRPVDAHDAALRVLAQYAPGLGWDGLEARAALAQAYASIGRTAPYIPVAHASRAAP